MKDKELRGQRLKAARQLADMNQKQLSEKLDVDQAFLSRVENGTNDGTVSLWRDAAAVLGVSLDYLLGLQDSPHQPVVQEASPMNRFSILADYTIAAGLRELAMDEVLIDALAIQEEEWAQLASVSLSTTVSKDGYMQLLITLRSISQTSNVAKSNG